MPPVSGPHSACPIRRRTRVAALYGKNASRVRVDDSCRSPSKHARACRSLAARLIPRQGCASAPASRFSPSLLLLCEGRPIWLPLQRHRRSSCSCSRSCVLNPILTRLFKMRFAISSSPLCRTAQPASYTSWPLRSPCAFVVVRLPIRSRLTSRTTELRCWSRSRSPCAGAEAAFGSCAGTSSLA